MLRLNHFTVDYRYAAMGGIQLFSTSVLALKDHAMKISAAFACFVLAIVASLVSQTFAVTVQTAADVFNTRPSCGWRQRALARLPTAT